jgi:uncharacterized alkaline shock family protein YloU
MSDIKDYISYTDDDGSVNISEDVLAIIAGSAAAETEGVHALYPSYGRDIGELLSKKSLSRSVKIAVSERSVTIDVFIVVELAVAVNSVAEAVQRAIAEVVETSVGVKPDAVNVHICGISLKKNK